MCVIHLVQGNIDLQILLGKGHILVQLPKCILYELHHPRRGRGTYLERFIEIPNLAQAVQKYIDSGLVILHKRIQCAHVRLFGVRWLIGEIL